jgi:hypothetical protein
MPFGSACLSNEAFLLAFRMKKMKFLLRGCHHVRDLLELWEVQSLLKEQQSQYDKGLAELTTTLEGREKRRLDDLVVLQQDSNWEYK